MSVKLVRPRPTSNQSAGIVCNGDGRSRRHEHPGRRHRAPSAPVARGARRQASPRPSARNGSVNDQVARARARAAEGAPEGVEERRSSRAATCRGRAPPRSQSRRGSPLRIQAPEPDRPQQPTIGRQHEETSRAGRAARRRSRVAECRTRSSPDRCARRRRRGRVRPASTIAPIAERCEDRAECVAGCRAAMARSPAVTLRRADGDLAATARSARASERASRR